MSFLTLYIELTDSSYVLPILITTIIIITVLPRIHQLMQYILSTNSILDDTIQSMTKRITTTTTTEKYNRSHHDESSQENASPVPLNALEDIARACSILLGAIPERHLLPQIVRDLIGLLQDTNTLLSYKQSSSLNDWNRNTSFLIFTNTVQHSPMIQSTCHDFLLDIPSLERLVLLQTFVLHLLLNILSDMISTSYPMTHDLSSLILNAEDCPLLLDGIHQISIRSTTHFNDSDSPPNEFHPTQILIQTNKTLALLMLQILIPQIIHSAPSPSVMYHSFMNIVVNAVLEHFRISSDFIIERTAPYDDSNMDILLKLDRQSALSCVLTTLLEQMCIQAPIPFIRVAKLQQYHIHVLFSCLPYAWKLVEPKTENKYDSFSKLLWTLLLFLHTCLSASCDSVDRQVLRSILDYFETRPVWSTIFELLQIPTYSHVTMELIILLWKGAYKSVEIEDLTNVECGLITQRATTIMESLSLFIQKAFTNLSSGNSHNLFIGITLLEDFIVSDPNFNSSRHSDFVETLFRFYDYAVQECQKLLLSNHTAHSALLPFSFVHIILFLDRRNDLFPSTILIKRSLMMERVKSIFKDLLHLLSPRYSRSVPAKQMADTSTNIFGLTEHVIQRLKPSSILPTNGSYCHICHYFDSEKNKEIQHCPLLHHLLNIAHMTKSFKRMYILSTLEHILDQEEM